MRRLGAFLLLATVFLYPARVWSADKPSIIPCMLFKDGDWKPHESEKCRQLTAQQVKENNRRLLELKSLREHAAQGAKLRLDYQNLVSTTEKERVLHQREAAELKKEAGRQSEMAKTWEKAFVRLKNERLPPRHWTEHPAFWFGVGFIAAGAVAGVTVAVVITVRR